MKCKILSKEGFQITTLEEYKKLAPPMGKDKQWKDGRSAKEFARYLIAAQDELPKEIEEVIAPFSHERRLLALHAEHITSFGEGFGRGKGRDHDGLLVGENFVVGIEAKADEPFDNKYLDKYLNKPSKNEPTRYQVISKCLFGEGGPTAPQKVRYQLCSAAVGTMVEAVNSGKKIAVLLVIVFESGETNEKRKKRNNLDYENFKKELHSLGDDRYETPYSEENEIEFYLKKVTIKI